MTKPLAYVAGPISGDPFGCVRQAAAAFCELRALGFVPFLPQLSVLHEMVDPHPYETWLAYDFDVIERCDVLVRLAGVSPGADHEVEHALEHGVLVFLWDEDGRHGLANFIESYRRFAA